jgi:hypothetical protein
MDSQRYGVINQCDRWITLLSDADISLIYLTCYLFGYIFWVIVSNTLNVIEILKIYLIEQKIYPNHQDEWYIYHSMSLTVLYLSLVYQCTATEVFHKYIEC